MAFLAGIGWRLQRKFRAISSQTSLQLSQRHTIICQSPCPVTQGCSIPTAKVGKDHPDLITHDDPRLSHEDQSQSGFPSRKGKGSRRCVRGTSTGFLARRQGARNLEGPLQKRNFWLVFREAHPQIAFTAFRPTAKLAPAKVAQQKLTLELFL